MLIHIDESVVDDVASRSATADHSHATIENLLLAHFQGDHVTSIDPRDVTRLLDLHWSRRAKRALLHVDENFPQIGGLRAEVPWSLEVGHGAMFDGTVRAISEHQWRIRVGVAAFDHTNKSSFAVLLGENRTDADLFFELARIMLAVRRWNELQICYDKRGGGGSTTAREYQQLADLGRVIVAIADKDETHPSSGPGDTYRELQNEARSRPAYQRVRPLHTRTAEGLIPLDIYEKVFENSPSQLGCLERLAQLMRSTPNNFLRYAHLKEGFRLYQVEHANNEGVGRYWSEIAKHSGRDRCKFPVHQQCTQRANCQCFVLDPLGAQALAQSVRWLQAQKSMKQLAARFGLAKDSASDLSRLADEVLAWGLALQPLS